MCLCETHRETEAVDWDLEFCSKLITFATIAYDDESVGRIQIEQNMESPGAVGRRRGTSRSNVEDQALDQIAKEVSQSFYSIFLTIQHRFAAEAIDTPVSFELNELTTKEDIFWLQMLDVFILHRKTKS